MVNHFYKTWLDPRGISRRGCESGCHCHHSFLQFINLFSLFLTVLCTRIHAYRCMPLCVRAHTHTHHVQICTSMTNHFRKTKFSFSITLTNYIPGYVDFNILWILPWLAIIFGKYVSTIKSKYEKYFECSNKAKNGNTSILNEAYFSQVFQKIISPGKKIIFQILHFRDAYISSVIARRKYSVLRYICAKVVTASIMQCDFFAKHHVHVHFDFCYL